MTNKVQSLLESWLALRGLTEDELRQRFQIGEVHFASGQSIRNIDGLTLLYNEATMPGPLYLRSGRFILLEIGRASPAIGSVGEVDLRRVLGKPEAELSSSVGAHFRNYVYPSQGVAFSSNGRQVGLLEIFQPMTLEEYKKVFHIEPGEFIR